MDASDGRVPERLQGRDREQALLRAKPRRTGGDVRCPVLATVPGAASREGGVLRLKLAGERTFKLTDCVKQPACDGEKLRFHRLAAWWPKHRYYVVAVWLYEASVAYLVSERDGRALVVTAPPVLSPSGRTAVALVSDLMSGVDLELIDLSRDPPTVAKVDACRPARAGATAPCCGPSRSGLTTRTSGSRASRRSPATIRTPSSS